jgi:hypothetical protein
MRLDPLSKSTYSKWLWCPWFAHAQKNLKLPSVSGPAAERGKETHGLIEGVIKGELDFQDIPKKASDEEIAAWAQRAFSFHLPSASEMLIEQHVMIDKNGVMVDRESNAMLHGYLDVMWKETEKTARFIDWKTSKWQQWNDFESHLYALGVKATFPEATKVIAELCFLRTGDIIRTEYEWQDNDSFCIITMNDGQEDILWAERNPLLDYFSIRIDKIHATDPLPRPGRHCMKWYGNPCQYLGQECPLTQDKALINLAAKELADPARYTKALRHILKGDRLTKEIAGDGLYAIQQHKQLLAIAETAVQDWSRENGPIKIGNTNYGWKKGKSNKVDVPFVIQTLLDHEIPIEEWSKVMSISKNSIGRLSKKQYKETREVLDTLAIKTVPGEERFTEIK